MPERAYTVAEIDEMRELVRDLIEAQAQSHRDSDRTEDRLRTYMLAGIEPKELAEAAIVAKDDLDARMVAKTKGRLGPGSTVTYTNWRGEQVTA